MSRFLIDAMEDARQCTLTLIDGLDKDQLKGPMLASPMIGVAFRGRMIRNTWCTYYGAEWNDVFAGFRTCAP